MLHHPEASSAYVLKDPENIPKITLFSRQQLSTLKKAKAALSRTTSLLLLHMADELIRS
jgi:hypothetical protein